jgi:hypothetical protein
MRLQRLEKPSTGFGPMGLLKNRSGFGFWGARKKRSQIPGIALVVYTVLKKEIVFYLARFFPFSR